MRWYQHVLRIPRGRGIETTSKIYPYLLLAPALLDWCSLIGTADHAPRTMPADDPPVYFSSYKRITSSLHHRINKPQTRNRVVQAQVE